MRHPDTCENRGLTVSRALIAIGAELLSNSSLRTEENGTPEIPVFFAAGNLQKSFTGSPRRVGRN